MKKVATAEVRRVPAATKVESPVVAVEVVVPQPIHPQEEVSP
jgi:hypothetical protein